MTCEEWEEAVCGPELLAQGDMSQHLSSCANCQSTWRVLQLASHSTDSNARPLRKARKPFWVGLSALAATVLGVVFYGGLEVVDLEQATEVYDELSVYEVPWSEEDVP